MKKILDLSLVLLLLMSCTQCTHKSKPSTGQESLADSMGVGLSGDTAVYGICGEETAMHTLQLITNTGDTLNYMVYDNDDAPSTVKGGLLVGDRLSVQGYKNADGEWTAQQVVNISSLIGKWTSLDKNFEIEEGGTVKSYVKAESHPWTSWKMYNGNIILNTDTFAINELGNDSLYLENKVGIFAYKRQK